MARTPGRPRVTAFGVSIAVHAALAVALLIFGGLGQESVSTKTPAIHTDLVYLQQRTVGSGGGGSPAPAPPKPIQIPEHRQPTLAIQATAVPADPPPMLEAPIQANSSMLQASGITANAPPGPGGGGTGNSGVGPGDGPGVGRGKLGAGGGDRGACGFIDPAPIRETKAAYTPGALAAKIRGSVTLEAEVLANGTVGSVKVVKSLDRVYGLDQEAIRAARQWIFRPAKCGDKAIDVVVTLILEFNLR